MWGPFPFPCLPNFLCLSIPPQKSSMSGILTPDDILTPDGTLTFNAL